MKIQSCLKLFIFQIFAFISMVQFIFYLRCSEHVSSKIFNQKYITSSFDHPADLGNMLYRLASLYGIGKELKRIPYVNGYIESQLKGLTEISEYFPLLHDIVQIKVPHESLITVANFTDFCCIYESPKNLQKYDSTKFLKLSANYLQSYKYFTNFQTDIAQLMECTKNIKQKSDDIANKLWKRSAKNNESFFNSRQTGWSSRRINGGWIVKKCKYSNLHKMCVHVRRGDFLGSWQLESRTDFTLPAIKHIFEELSAKQKKKISLLFLGNDELFIDEFNHSLNLSFRSIDNLFGFNTSRSFDMCFGIQHCDSLLMSASSSTYAWWIGYLMKSQGPVYYNAVITKIGTHAKDLFDYDLFPSHWTKLLLKNGTVKIETKWTVERNKIN